MALPSPCPTESPWKEHTLRSPIFTGQLSPVGSIVDAGLDDTASMVSSSAPLEIRRSGYRNHQPTLSDPHWPCSEEVEEHGCVAPKIEPVEDEIKLDQVIAAPSGPHGEFKQKRARVRPRKHPLPCAEATSKTGKGRSKTGCITCRKRKKKCDEAKPRCMNCEKNAVVCEGYQEKLIWKSGKDRANESQVKQEIHPGVIIPPIFHGVETGEDRILWKHYMGHLSNVLTVEGEARNAFKDIMLPLATKHQGLMHSILALSSKHLDLDSPYGTKVFRDNPSITRETLEARGQFHHEEALRRLYRDLEASGEMTGLAPQTVLAARYGQMMCLLLQTKAEGNPRGEHRVHLQAYQALVQQSPLEDEALHAFIVEFFQYHVYADNLLWHPSAATNHLRPASAQSLAQILRPRLFGVGDGFLGFLEQITVLRETVRGNMNAGMTPVVDHCSLYRAAEIDAAIREWSPTWPVGDCRHRVGPLYKQMMWVYLFRTIYPPPLESVRQPSASSKPVTPTAPGSSDFRSWTRRPSMTASVGSSSVCSTVTTDDDGTLSSCQTPISCSPSRHPSRTNSVDEQDWRPTFASAYSAAECTSPMQASGHYDQRITIAVEEALGILESFAPSDPAQTLLLIPCLVIGTACFTGLQQERVRAAVRAVRGYTGLRNCDRATELLTEIWTLMKHGEWLAVWDWQSVAQSKGLDFLCA